ncbi:MAG TPA: hypothetical protein VHX18_09465 [Rhizomicrobium sp.]|jgi:hypothetical protein|nr:hypothetical protein [Rhizomicrobium sp.]
MKWFAILIWFLISFVTGVAIYLAVAPNPVIEAIVQELNGTNVLDRCVKAARCRKVQQAPAKPGHYRMAPDGLDRG